MRQQSIVLLAVVALVVGPATVLAATPAPGSQPVQSVQPNETDRTLDELSDNGEIIDEDYPALRKATSTKTFQLVRYPPSGFNSYGGENAQKKPVGPDTTVRRNRIRLYANHPYDGQRHNYTLQIVYWRPDSREVERTTENGTTVTTTERFPNITGTTQQSVSFAPGFKKPADLRLHGHWDDGVRVTVFLEVADTLLQWTFEHKSIATAQPVNIDTHTDLFSWLLVWILLPTAVVEGIVSKGIPALRRRAGAGTGHSPLWWIGGGAIAGVILYSAGTVFWASIVAAVPFTFAGLVGWITGAVLLEQDNGAVEAWGLVHMDPEEYPSPLDQETAIKSAETGRYEQIKVIETPDGEPALWHPGLFAFIARALGHYATLDIKGLRAEFEMTGDIDTLLVVHPDVDEVLAHERTRWLIQWPWRTHDLDLDDRGDGDGSSLVALGEDGLTPIERQKVAALPAELTLSHYLRTALLVLGVLGAYHAGTVVFDAEGVGGIAAAVAVIATAAVYYATPLEGWATTRVATAHGRAAWVTAWYTNLNIRRFEGIEQLAQHAQRAHRRVENMKEWIQDSQTEGLIAESHEGQPLEVEMLQDDPAVGTGGSAGEAATDGGGGNDE